MKSLTLALLAVGGYALAFAVPYGAAGILVALPCIFLLGRLSSPRRVFYSRLSLGVALYVPHLGHVPPDRWFAFICSIATGLFALYLLLRRLIGRTTAATSGDRLPQPLG